MSEHIAVPRTEIFLGKAGEQAAVKEAVDALIETIRSSATIPLDVTIHVCAHADRPEEETESQKRLNGSSPDDWYNFEDQMTRPKANPKALIW